MIRCLICHERFVERMSWRTLLMLERPTKLCDRCENKLEKITDPSCHRCFRPLSSENVTLCFDCVRWERILSGDVLQKNVSLYRYNDELKEWIATYKFRGDAQIATYFADKLARAYKIHFKGYIPIEIPLSDERLKERGFNQSALLMEGWAEETNVLRRKEGEKQSKRKRKERIAQLTKSPFQLNEEKLPLIRNKNIVLIDDIYTTGTTVRQAALVLKRHGANNVASLTIAR